VAVNVPAELERQSPTVDNLVDIRNELRRRGQYGAADDFREYIGTLRVGMYRVALDDQKDGGTWHWTAHE